MQILGINRIAPKPNTFQDPETREPYLPMLDFWLDLKVCPETPSHITCSITFLIACLIACFIYCLLFAAPGPPFGSQAPAPHPVHAAGS